MRFLQSRSWLAPLLLGISTCFSLVPTRFKSRSYRQHTTTYIYHFKSSFPCQFGSQSHELTTVTETGSFNVSEGASTGGTEIWSVAPSPMLPPSNAAIKRLRKKQYRRFKRTAPVVAQQKQNTQEMFLPHTTKKWHPSFLKLACLCAKRPSNAQLGPQVLGNFFLTKLFFFWMAEMRLLIHIYVHITT